VQALLSSQLTLANPQVPLAGLQVGSKHKLGEVGQALGVLMQVGVLTSHLVVVQLSGGVQVQHD